MEFDRSCTDASFYSMQVHVRQMSAYFAPQSVVLQFALDQFQLHRYATPHRIQHISTHRHNPEPPLPPPPSLQHREAATASAGKNSPSFNFCTIHFPQLTFYHFSINLLRHPPRDPTYLGPQTQPRAAATNTTFATAQRSSDRERR